MHIPEESIEKKEEKNKWTFYKAYCLI
jgi:hypothetical protein